jgi:hypothetical protein
MVFKKLFGFSKIFLIKKNEIFIIIEIFCCTKTETKQTKKDNILLYQNKKAKTNFIVAHVPSQESEQYCNCVLGIIDIKKRFCIFLRYFYFILKLLRQCDILCFLSFHFITEI